MKCQNTFCVYWKKNKCILEEISLDISGQCEDCILIDMDEKFLEEQRKKLLDKLD